MYRQKATTGEDEKISFPLLECWNPMTEVATIAAEVNKKRILCRIPMTVLKKKFRASSDDPMQAVVENRTAIRAAARRLIEGMRFDDDGSVIIGVDDI